MILSCSFSSSGDARTCTGLDQLSQRLIGKQYGFVDDGEVVGDGDETEGVREIWSWLKREMCV